MQYLLVSSAMLRSFSSDGESESEVDVSWLGLRFFEEKKKSVVRTYIIESGKKDVHGVQNPEQILELLRFIRQENRGVIR